MKTFWKKLEENIFVSYVESTAFRIKILINNFNNNQEEPFFNSKLKIARTMNF